MAMKSHIGENCIEAFQRGYSRTASRLVGFREGFTKIKRLATPNKVLTIFQVSSEKSDGLASPGETIHPTLRYLMALPDGALHILLARKARRTNLTKPIFSERSLEARLASMFCPSKQ